MGHHISVGVSQAKKGTGKTLLTAGKACYGAVGHECVGTLARGAGEQRLGHTT